MENVTHTCEQATPLRQKTFSQLIISKLINWHRNYKTRRHLRDLPEHLWDDIGLEKKEVICEIRKPFWIK
jgi:uncharacterized protein YjiS (DUF1127 family)